MRPIDLCDDVIQRLALACVVESLQHRVYSAICDSGARESSYQVIKDQPPGGVVFENLFVHFRGYCRCRCANSHNNAAGRSGDLRLRFKFIGRPVPQWWNLAH